MRQIPQKLRQELEDDPWYHRCCLTGIERSSTIKIEWHHNFIYAGRQINEKWCIIPLWNEIHEKATDPDIKDKLDWIMLSRAGEATLKKYSKAIDLERRKRLLIDKFGIWKPLK